MTRSPVLQPDTPSAQGSRVHDRIAPPTGAGADPWCTFPTSPAAHGFGCPPWPRCASVLRRLLDEKRDTWIVMLLSDGDTKQ